MWVKRDDILIRVGVPMLLVSFLVLVGSVHNTRSFLLALLFALAPVGLLIAGGYYRHKERRMVAIRRIVERATTVRMSDLTASAGFRREEVLDTIRIVNGRNQVPLVHDPNTDVISWLKPPEQRRCWSCSKPFHGENDAVSALTCRHCGASVASADWKVLRDLVMAELRKPGAITVMPPESFSLPVFVMLAIFCWPAALVYYAIKHRRQSGG